MTWSEYLSRIAALAAEGRNAQRPDALEAQVAVMSALVGRDIRGPHRRHIDCTARQIVMHSLGREGYRVEDIAAALHRDRCTVIYGKRRVDEMISLPEIYRTELNLYDAFHKLI